MTESLHDETDHVLPATFDDFYNVRHHSYERWTIFEFFIGIRKYVSNIFDCFTTIRRTIEQMWKHHQSICPPFLQTREWCIYASKETNQIIQFIGRRFYCFFFFLFKMLYWDDRIEIEKLIPNSELSTILKRRKQISLSIATDADESERNTVENVTYKPFQADVYQDWLTETAVEVVDVLDKVTAAQEFQVRRLNLVC